MGSEGKLCHRHSQIRTKLCPPYNFNLLMLLCALCPLAHGFKDYHSCLDVKNDLGSQATDGEYIIYLSSLNNVGINVYCHGLQSADYGPQSYITLPAGPMSNFASFYENVGVPDFCADAFPRKLYSQGGRTEFGKIAVNMYGLDVDPGDFSFTHGTNRIRYGSAGDNWTSSDSCYPMGSFQIDLTGTPFTVVKETIWQWSGSHVRGNLTGGYARINDHTYLGCFADKVDRLLPAGRQDDQVNNTIDNCISHCKSLKYAYAGVEYGVECHCGNDYGRYGTQPASEANCNKQCSGNRNQTCGGTWFISVYSTAIPQRITGHCGGFPGQCFPATTYNYKEENLALDLMHNQHICIRSNPCQNEGRCVAVDADTFKCVCYDGYSGTNCETVQTTVVDDGRTCPAGYQAETCMCFEPKCNGARFEGDTCVSSTGHAQVVCRPGDPGHVILFNVNSYGTVSCPVGAEIVGCSYWADFAAGVVHGQGFVDRGVCSVSTSATSVQARCKQYVCGCLNGGHCNKVTGQCECPPSYYGAKCETFDYCTYYEKINNKTACDSGGVCTPVYKEVINTVGGDKAGSTCIFPFDYGDYTFNTCVDDNLVGPPFACGGEFALSENFKNGPTYIDLGPWSPGPRYTVAAWVRPDRIDTMRQTIVGGASDCNDFGFNFNSGTFRGYLKLSTECTRDLDAGKPLANVGTWYMVAVTSNASHASIYQNGQFKDSNTVLLNHIPTTAGFWIGSAVCCSLDYFRGMIKTVKVWNRELTNDEINRSMYNFGTKNSTMEALYDGLVGHWELGDTSLPPCSGDGAVDHGGDDWILKDTEIVSGIHCNISRFIIPKGVTVIVARYNGSTGGKLDVTAQEVQIDGYLDAVGAGYQGAGSSISPGNSGSQGWTYSGRGTLSLQPNYGGGGGGMGGNNVPDGTGRSGGGGGYGTPGSSGVKVVGDRTGLGSGGNTYGDPDLNHLYMGSGGGSGGNAKDLATNPRGGRGGNGGGAVKIVAERSIIISGVISVAGENGQGDIPAGSGCMGCPDACDLKSPVRCLGNSTTACWDMSGPGGGGSGGSIYLSAKLVDVGYQKLWAMGGEGGTGGSHCCGGQGGMGRIRVDSLIMKGIVGDVHGVLKNATLTNQFVDHSQTGQKQIDYRTTVYGNEVFRGCFRDDPTNRTLAAIIATTDVTRTKMTPDYCKQLCRQRNFMFSGTSNNNECYCDNHLDMSRKVPDQECRLACQGDPLWTCGGRNRLQVFGPPPGAPALGHNVLVKCDPWCVTSDANTPKPKWGQCLNKAPSVASWDVKCECTPGKTGSTCDQLCPPWTYGLGCRRNCTCSQNNTALCDPTNGQCSCQPGYRGNSCQDQCPSGFFGEGCSSVCNCSSHSVCDHVTGSCVCKAGWTGPNCNFPCPANTFGVNCSGTCQCFQGTCNPVDGTCDCRPGYKLPFCSQKCDPFNYGPNCEQNCDCNSQECDAMTGRCQCGPGFRGTKCEMVCGQGTWGQNCASQCQCSGFGCDPVTGQCYCGPGYMGETCELACAAGVFGLNCQFTCPCVENQTSACDVATGKCICKSGYQGVVCQSQCPKGFYGPQCAKQCACNGSECDFLTGACICPSGYIGMRCRLKCQNQTFGYNCQFKCPDCGSFSYPGCHVETGACLCSNGYTGPLCMSPCPAGTYGANCSQTCSCDHGVCDHVTGVCHCSSGYTGDACQTSCAAGRWGINCAKTCDCGPYGAGCTPDEGVCLCKSGFMGVKCRESCPVGFYGQNCTSKCICDLMAGTCSPIDGTCLCNSGYTGQYCDQVCGPGLWGRSCTQQCQCNGRGSCNPFNGECDCIAGYKGRSCDMQCDQDLYWGKNCANPCSCNGAHCDHRDGTCRCPPGKKGHHCEQGCDPGYFGFQCAQLCGCQNNAVCDSVTGACRCQPGWAGQFCDKSCPDGYYGVDCAQNCLDCWNDGTCDSFSGTCICAPDFTGQFCNTSLVSGSQLLQSQAQTQTTSSGIVLTVSQLVGLVVGFALLLVVVTILAVVITKKCSVGRFWGAHGAMKFKEEPVCVSQPSGNNLANADSFNITSAGFSNPVHESSYDETELDRKSVGSDATSGVASAMVDSDDDDNFFKDSNA